MGPEGIPRDRGGHAREQYEGKLDPNERFRLLSAMHERLIEEHREANGEEAQKIENRLSNILDEMHRLLQDAIAGRKGREEGVAPVPETQTDEREAEENRRAEVLRIRSEVRALIQKRENTTDPAEIERIDRLIEEKVKEFPSRD